LRKNSNKLAETTPHKAFQYINYILMTFIAVICLLPMINLLAVSFSSSTPVLAGEVKLWPVDFTTSSYSFVMANADFWRSMIISLERVILGGVIGIILTILAAYPLSKEASVFKARTFYVWFLFISTLFSGGLIPSYLMVTWTHLYNTIWALIIPGAVGAFNVILMLNFFRQLPGELEEAAIIDGAGHWQILWKIVVPISKPVIATVLLFILVGHWNAWFDGYIYINSSKNYPLQTYLYSLLTLDISMLSKSGVSQDVINSLSKVNPKTLKAAQIFIATLPILCVYPFMQKYFTKGIILGSVKG
jgi:putative aldouronate transport system permease protein